MLITHKPLITNADKEKLLEISFNVFSANKICLISDVEMSLFSAGKSTALVIDIGYHSTHICPIYEGVLVGSRIVVLY